MALVIDEDVKARIQHLAGKHRRSTSGEIVVAIESWIQQHSSELDDFQPAG
jgi:predicted transcriptional regulator